MPLAVFPVQPSYGYSSGVSFDEVMRVYADLSYRRYLKSSAAHKTRALQFEDLSQSEKDSIEAFFIARKQETGANSGAFYCYDPDQVNQPDPTGTSTTGRHTAIFLDSEIDFTRDDACSYSGSVNVLFLD
jgi:hypothetical protein